MGYFSIYLNKERIYIYIYIGFFFSPHVTRSPPLQAERTAEEGRRKRNRLVTRHSLRGFSSPFFPTPVNHSYAAGERERGNLAQGGAW